MRAAAHDPEFAKRMGIPQSIAREFVAADQARKKKKSKVKARKDTLG